MGYGRFKVTLKNDELYKFSNIIDTKLIERENTLRLLAATKRLSKNATNNSMTWKAAVGISWVSRTLFDTYDYKVNTTISIMDSVHIHCR